MIENKDIKFRVLFDDPTNVSGKFEKIDKAIDSTGKSMGNMSSNTQNANMLLFSTGRIIQDLPYGFMGIGNNITFMAEQMGYMRSQGMGFKDMLLGMGKSLLGTGGIVFAISAATTALTFLSNGFRSAKGDADELNKSLKEMIKVQTPRGVFEIAPENLGNAVKLFQREISEYKDLLKRASDPWGGKPGPFTQYVKVNKDNLTNLKNSIKILEDSLVIIQDAKTKEDERLRIVQLIKDAGLDYKEEIDGQNKGLDKQRKLLEDIAKMTAGRINKNYAIQNNARHPNEPNFDSISNIDEYNQRMGRYYMKQITASESYKENFKFMVDIMRDNLQIIRGEFSTLWQNVFGEANSLFEKLLMNFASRLAEHGISSLFGSLLNFIFPGAGMALGASGSLGGGPQIINLQADNRTLATFYVTGKREAERLRF